jgi:hypothetical protein
MKFLRVTCLASFIFLFACNDEKGEELTPLEDFSSLMTIIFSDYLSNGVVGYVVVTDTLGAIIGKVEIVNSTTASIVPEKSFQGQTINAYFLLGTEEFFFHTHAYLHIKRGSTYDFSPTFGYGARDPIRLKMINVPQFDFLTMGTNMVARTYRDSNLSDTTDWGTRISYIEGGSIYAQVINQGEGRYDFLPISDDKETYDVDFAALTGISLRKNISVPDNLYGSYDISGYEPSDNPSSDYELFGCDFSGPSFEIYYPDRPFSMYATSLWLSTGTNFISYNRFGAVPYEYPRLTFSSTVGGNHPNNFSHFPSGDFDYYNAKFSNPETNKYVSVYAPRKVRKFSLPDFSSILPIGARDFNSCKLHFLSLTDVLGHVEDKPYFQIFSSYPPHTPNTPNIDMVSYAF